MTVEIQMTWRDHKLVFENILDGKENLHSFNLIAKREFGKNGCQCQRLSMTMQLQGRLQKIFDEQACNFILMMKLKGNNSIKFTETMVREY